MGDQYIQMMARKRYEDKQKMRRMREREKVERRNITEQQLTQDSKVAHWDHQEFEQQVRRNDSEFLKEFNKDDVKEQIAHQKRIFEQNQFEAVTTGSPWKGATPTNKPQWRGFYTYPIEQAKQDENMRIWEHSDNTWSPRVHIH